MPAPKHDQALTELASVLGDMAEAQAHVGRSNVEAALYQARILLIGAAFDDGVSLDLESIGLDAGIVNDF